MNIYQVINYLSNFCIPYKDITVQNKAWEEMIMDGESGTTPLEKGAPTHSGMRTNRLNLYHYILQLLIYSSLTLGYTEMIIMKQCL